MRSTAIRSHVAVLLFSLALIGHVRAYESGTPTDRAAIISDARILLIRTVHEEHKSPRDLVISDTVTDGHWAVAVFRIGNGYHGFMTLQKISGAWWDMAEASFDTERCAILRGTLPIQPTNVDYAFGLSSACLKAGGLSGDILVRAGRIGGIAKADRARRDALKRIPEYILDIHGDALGPKTDGITKSGGKLDDSGGVLGGGFDTTIKFAKPLEYVPSRVAFFYAHRPAKGSSEPVRLDALYFFRLELSSMSPTHFAEGTSVDVWFPYVLSPIIRYSGRARSHETTFGSVTGILKADNTLHFVLPEFTLPPFDSMTFEIDGDP